MRSGASSTPTPSSFFPCLTANQFYLRPFLALRRPRAPCLQDATFHQCVNLGAYDAQKMVTFVPPDGEFELLRCGDGGLAGLYQRSLGLCCSHESCFPVLCPAVPLLRPSHAPRYRSAEGSAILPFKASRYVADCWACHLSCAVPSRRLLAWMPCHLLRPSSRPHACPPVQVSSPGSRPAPAQVLPVITEVGRTKLEANVAVKSTFSNKLAASAVVLLVPVPDNTASAKLLVTAGKAKYDATRKALVWKVRGNRGHDQVSACAVSLLLLLATPTQRAPALRHQVPKFTGGAEHTLRAEVTLVASTRERKPWGRFARGGGKASCGGTAVRQVHAGFCAPAGLGVCYRDVPSRPLHASRPGPRCRCSSRCPCCPPAGCACSTCAWWSASRAARTRCGEGGAWELGAARQTPWGGGGSAGGVHRHVMHGLRMARDSCPTVLPLRSVTSGSASCSRAETSWSASERRGWLGARTGAARAS
jgi:hypothetical protein